VLIAIIETREKVYSISSSPTRISSNQLLYHIAIFIVLAFAYYISKFYVRFIFIFGRKRLLTNETSVNLEVG
jgi:hypothetical protein